MQEGVEQCLKHLGAVQIDPINVFERNHHHVLFSRVEGYRPAMLEQLLYSEKRAFEYFANALCVLPMEDYPFFAFRMKDKQAKYKLEPEVVPVAEDVLNRLQAEGALGSRHFDGSVRIRNWWQGKGVAGKAAKRALDDLHYLGLVMITDRSGMERTYDLPERVVPTELRNIEVTAEQYKQHIFRKFLYGYGLSQKSLFRFGWFEGQKQEATLLLKQGLHDGSIIEVEVESVKRRYYCPNELLPELVNPAACLPQQAVFAAPLDNLLWDRDRLLDIFDFDYRWEVYTPEAKRKYGYYVLPVLYGESFVGRIELKAQRDQGVLHILNTWLVVDDLTIRDAVVKTIADIAQYLGLEVGGSLC